MPYCNCPWLCCSVNEARILGELSEDVICAEMKLKLPNTMLLLGPDLRLSAWGCKHFAKKAANGILAAVTCNCHKIHDEMKMMQLIDLWIGMGLHAHKSFAAGRPSMPEYLLVYQGMSRCFIKQSSNKTPALSLLLCVKLISYVKVFAPRCKLVPRKIQILRFESLR